MTNWLSVSLWMLYSISHNYKSLIELLLLKGRWTQTNKITLYFTFNQDYWPFAARFSDDKNNWCHIIYPHVFFLQSWEITFYCPVGQFLCRCVNIFNFSIKKIKRRKKETICIDCIYPFPARLYSCLLLHKFLDKLSAYKIFSNHPPNTTVNLTTIWHGSSSSPKSLGPQKTFHCQI